MDAEQEYANRHNPGSISCAGSVVDHAEHRLGQQPEHQAKRDGRKISQPHSASRAIEDFRFLPQRIRPGNGRRQTGRKSCGQNGCQINQRHGHAG